jgi:hypothetical protein
MDALGPALASSTKSGFCALEKGWADRFLGLALPIDSHDWCMEPFEGENKPDWPMLVKLVLLES